MRHYARAYQRGFHKIICITSCTSVLALRSIREKKRFGGKQYRPGWYREKVPGWYREKVPVGVVQVRGGTGAVRWAVLEFYFLCRYNILVLWTEKMLDPIN